MACCVQRSITRVADRSGRQTLVVVKVVLGIRFEILVTQLAAGASQTIQNGCIHLQIRELGGIVQTVVDNARNACALIVTLCLTLNERGDRDNIVHRAAKILRAGLDVRVITAALPLYTS